MTALCGRLQVRLCAVLGYEQAGHEPEVVFEESSGEVIGPYVLFACFAKLFSHGGVVKQFPDGVSEFFSVVGDPPASASG